MASLNARGFWVKFRPSKSNPKTVVLFFQRKNLIKIVSKTVVPCILALIVSEQKTPVGIVRERLKIPQPRLGSSLTKK